MARLRVPQVLEGLSELLNAVFVSLLRTSGYRHLLMAARGRPWLEVTVPSRKPVSEDYEFSQVIEKTGGRHGIRTHGLLVANEALSQLS